MKFSLYKPLWLPAVIVLILSSARLEAQDPMNKHSIGFQGPVRIDRNLLTGASINSTFAIRYGYHINENITLGAEASGFYMFYLTPGIRDVKSYSLRLGPYGRYTLFPDKRVNLFAEANVYAAYFRFIPGSDPVFDNMDERKAFGLSAYAAPGISLMTKNRKVSLDMMYKFSDRTSEYGRQHGFSWRLNFHF